MLGLLHISFGGGLVLFGLGWLLVPELERLARGEGRHGLCGAER
jgi:hypothetical protein